MRMMNVDNWLFEGNELSTFLRRNFGVKEFKYIIDTYTNKLKFLVVDKNDGTIGYSFDPDILPTCEDCINAICCEVSNNNHKQICKFIQKLIYTDRNYERPRQYYSKPVL